MADTSVELVASLEHGTNTTDYFVPATHSSGQKQEPHSWGAGLGYKRLRGDYNSLKMAKMIEITDGDMESAQKRLSKLIRDVNKCITMISEK